MAHLLIVDDEPSICWGLKRLAGEMGCSVAAAASAEEGFREAEARPPDAIVLDVRLPGIDGLSAMERFRELSGACPIIVITAYGNLETAVEAVRSGAFEYLVKPFALDAAQQTIQRALQVLSGREHAACSDETAEQPGELVGDSPAMQDVFKQIALVAPTEACVHICGESGTGKELVARAIHRYSARAAGAFVPVNLAAVNPSVAESELFGHVRGAFTGADETRKGLLEQADGGTIFLDEVADIPTVLQVKLLRALEHGELWPVGADHPVHSDFRVISATHGNLQDRVAREEFRHDLFFRLVNYRIDIPPLRERVTDIDALARHFLARLGTRHGVARTSLTPEALAELKERPWHGNVRELQNAVEHALIVARGGAILPVHLPEAASPRGNGSGGDDEPMTATLRRWSEGKLAEARNETGLYDVYLQLVEPPLLEAALKKHNGRCAAAARHLGLHRTTLKKKLQQYGITDQSGKD